eukprot:618338_1
MSTIFVVLHLLITLIKSQSRVNLVSMTSSNSGWVEANQQMGSFQGGWITDTTICPYIYQCQSLSNGDRIYTYIDTRGYVDIRVSYYIRTSVLDSDDRCVLSCVRGTDPIGGSGWQLEPQTLFGDLTTPKYITQTWFRTDMDNGPSVGLDFWADMEAGEWCYLTIIVSGVPTQDPTLSTDNPTLNPAVPKPTSNPTLSPSKHPIVPRTTRSLSYNPTSSPTKSPTNVPTSLPSHNPTTKPTTAPTTQPTKRPTKAPINPGSPTRSPTPPTPLPTRSPSLYPTPSPTADTLSPSSQPSIISCGDQMSGPYKNAPISVEVRMPYRGDLQFDASRSSPLTITSLSVVFGTTPSGFDTDNDAIVSLQDIIAGVYTFTLIAEPATDQRYDVQVSCKVSFPTSAPQFSITTYPTELPSAVSQSTGNSIDITSSTPVEVNQMVQIMLGGSATCVLLCICGTAAALYWYKKREDEDRKRKYIVDRMGFAVHKNLEMHRMSSLRVQDEEMEDNIDAIPEARARTLLDWFTHVVGLPQYFSVFMENGYTSFCFVQYIESEQPIRDMGIKKRRHVALIMDEIRKLQHLEFETVDGRDIVRVHSTNTGVSEGINPHVAVDNEIDILMKDLIMTNKQLDAMRQSIDSVESDDEALDVDYGDIEGLDVDHGQMSVTATTGGDVVKSPAGERNISKCVECFQVKEGRIYDADGEFYCHECWSYYQVLCP